MESISQSSEHEVDWLLHRQQIPADGAKSRHSSRTAKGAGNLLLDFCHAPIALGLIVGERNAQVVQQGQHLLCR